MRYTLESPFGRWTEDGSRFVYDIDKVAETTGYTPDEVKAHGVPYCRRFRRTAGAPSAPSASAAPTQSSR